MMMTMMLAITGNDDVVPAIPMCNPSGSGDSCAVRRGAHRLVVVGLDDRLAHRR